MEEVGKLEAEVRTGSGKEFSHRLRATGRIPAVCYGGNQPVVSLAVDPRALKNALDPQKRHNTVITLTIKGDGAERRETVMLKDFQVHPTKRDVLHADFVRVDLTKEVHVTIPLILEGKAEGVKLGGLMHQVLRMIDIACLPDRIPVQVTADVSALLIGQALHISDLKMGEGVRPLHDMKQSIAVVVAPKAEKTAEEEAAEAAAAAGEAAAAEGAVPAEGAAAAAPAAGAEGDKKAAAKEAARMAAKSDRAAAKSEK